MIYIKNYPTLNSLSCFWNISTSTCSKLLNELIPFMYDYFRTFIPNDNLVELKSKSVLSDHISFIIDGTAISIMRRFPQDEYYRPDKGHFIQLLILANYDLKIIAVLGNP
jgi:hypothetical protein